MDQAGTGQAKGTVHIVGVLAPKHVLYAVVVGKRMTMTNNRKLSTCFRPLSDLPITDPLLTTT